MATQTLDPSTCGEPTDGGLLFGDPLPLSQGTPLLLSTQQVAAPILDSDEQQPVEANRETPRPGIGEICDRWPWVVVLVFVAAYLLARKAG